MFDQVLWDDAGGCEPVALRLASAAMYVQTGLPKGTIVSGIGFLSRDFPGFYDDEPVEGLTLSLSQNSGFPRISRTLLSGGQYSTRVLPSPRFQAMAASILASCLQLVYPLWMAEEDSPARLPDGRSSSPGRPPSSVRITLTPKKRAVYSLMRLTLTPHPARHCRIFEGDSTLIAIVSPAETIWPNTPLADARGLSPLPSPCLIRQVQPPSVCEWRARLDLPNIPLDLSVAQPLSCYFDSQTRWRMQTGAITQTVTLERRLLPDLLHCCDDHSTRERTIILALETMVAVDYSGKILNSTLITTLHPQKHDNHERLSPGRTIHRE